MDLQNAWERFARTGSVSSYLSYCRIREQSEQIGENRREEEPSADSYRRTGDRGEDRGGE